MTLTFYLPIKENDAELVCGDIFTLMLCVGIYPRPWWAVCQKLGRWALAGSQHFLIQSPVLGVMRGTEDLGTEQAGPFSLGETAMLNEAALAG